MIVGGRPRALDLYCGAGGASAGLAAAGFDVTGIDIELHRTYPFKFMEADVLSVDPEWIRASFDFVWSSPPCLAFTAYGRRPDHVKPALNLIPQTRKLLEAAGIPYVIENVTGARDHLRHHLQLCGSSFKLDVQRHRLFEASGFTIPPLPCDHSIWSPRFKPATNRTNLRRTVEVGVWRIPLETQHRAMGGCSWMSREDLSKSIPPAYAEHIGRAALDTIK